MNASIQNSSFNRKQYFGEPLHGSPRLPSPNTFCNTHSDYAQQYSYTRVTCLLILEDEGLSSILSRCPVGAFGQQWFSKTNVIG